MTWYLAEGGEFSGIWIVNILLVFVLLEYIPPGQRSEQLTTSGNTKLGGSPFVYTANPISMLKD